LFKGEVDVAQEIRVNQYKTACVYIFLPWLVVSLPWLVISIYSKLSSSSIQPFLKPVVPT